MRQKVRRRSWHHLSWIWAFVGRKKGLRKKAHLCNSKLCCLGHLQGLLAVLFIPWNPCHESSWELSRNVVLGDVKKIEVFSSHLPQASSLAHPHKCITAKIKTKPVNPGQMAFKFFVYWKVAKQVITTPHLLYGSLSLLGCLGVQLKTNWQK